MIGKSLSNRRQFLKTGMAGGIVAAGCLGAVAEERPSYQERGTFPQGDFVDIHVHLGQPWNERKELTAADLLRWMDSQDIAQAVVLPLVSPEAWFYPITTNYVLKQTKPFRDRLIPFCAIDPRTGVYGGKKHFADLLKRYQDAGAIGFGEHKWGGPIDDPRNIELMGACAEAELPVLFHLDNLRNTDAPGLPGLEKLMQAVPDVQLIGHGPGWWASISKGVTPSDFGGYPRGPVEPGGALSRLMSKYPQLHADLSAGSGHNAIERDTEYGREFLIRHADQIMFGTDYLAADQRIQQFELMASLDLPGDVQTRIFRQNARDLLGLEP